VFASALSRAFEPLVLMSADAGIDLSPCNALSQGQPIHDDEYLHFLVVSAS